METVFHTLEPVFDSRSKVLILGSMPSPRSREIGFYYGHPQNRFWKVLCGLLDEEIPPDPAGKARMLLRRQIALWDVLARCDIAGASDGSIRNPVPNDLSRILRAAPVAAVFTTGSTASQLYRKYCQKDTGIPDIRLPSTSPANCRVSVPELRAAYSEILAYTETRNICFNLRE